LVHPSADIFEAPDASFDFVAVPRKPSANDTETVVTAKANLEAGY
jgi:hypothetical protein